MHCFLQGGKREKRIGAKTTRAAVVIETLKHTSAQHDMQALRCHLFCMHSYNISACMGTDEGGFQYSISMW
jgi:hypothetical protein